MTIKELKSMPKEEFMTLPDATEEIYNALQNSKSGWITISHSVYLESHSGYTDAFGEGISMRLESPDEWYTTSVIKEINWEEEWFKTMNSIYNFKFKEDENKNN